MSSYQDWAETDLENMEEFMDEKYCLAGNLFETDFRELLSEDEDE